MTPTFADFSWLVLAAKEEVVHKARADLEEQLNELMRDFIMASLCDRGISEDAPKEERTFEVDDPNNTPLGHEAQQAFAPLQAFVDEHDLKATYDAELKFVPNVLTTSPTTIAQLTIWRNGKVLRKKCFRLLEQVGALYEASTGWLTELRIPSRVAEELYEKIITQLCELAGLTLEDGKLLNKAIDTDDMSMILLLMSKSLGGMSGPPQ